MGTKVMTPLQPTSRLVPLSILLASARHTDASNSRFKRDLAFQFCAVPTVDFRHSRFLLEPLLVHLDAQPRAAVRFSRPCRNQTPSASGWGRRSRRSADKTPGSAKTGSARLSASSRNAQDRGRTGWANLDVIGFGQRGVSFIRPIPSAWL